MLSRFYLIVDSTQCLEKFLDAGVRYIQLRIKDKSDLEYRREIRRARKFCEKYSATLIVNDCWQMAVDEGCHAVYLVQEDLRDADIAQIKQAGIKIGISTHDRAELAIAMAIHPDYVALGPIYATLLKRMPWRPQGLDKLQRWKQTIGAIPLFALGGFTPERAAGAFRHGEDSVCVVTDVAQHEDPVARVNEWLAITEHQDRFSQ